MQQTQNTPSANESRQSARDTPRLALIAAVAANGVIGSHNALPWHLPEDLRRFRALTIGHAVIMGRKTWESLGKPLAQRQNIVVTRDPHYQAPGAETAGTLDAALALTRLPPPVFCIGGGELYRAAIERADTLFITTLDRAFAGEVMFPEFDHDRWCEVSRERGRSDALNGIEYEFVRYERCASSDANRLDMARR